MVGGIILAAPQQVKRFCMRDVRCAMFNVQTVSQRNVSNFISDAVDTATLLQSFIEIRSDILN